MVVDKRVDDEGHGRTEAHCEPKISNGARNSSVRLPPFLPTTSSLRFVRAIPYRILHVRLANNEALLDLLEIFEQDNRAYPQASRFPHPLNTSSSPDEPSALFVLYVGDASV